MFILAAILAQAFAWAIPPRAGCSEFEYPALPWLLFVGGAAGGQSVGLECRDWPLVVTAGDSP